jgi:tetratricopeptide (TPR) repeat protein
LVEEALRHVDRYVVSIPYAETSRPPVSAAERLALAHLVLANRLSSWSPERAHEHLISAKRLDPDLAIAWFLDWEVLGDLGRRQEAEASLAQARRLAPAGSSLGHRIAKLVGPPRPVADP